MVRVPTVTPPAVPTRVWVPSTVQVTATPCEVTGVLGTPRDHEAIGVPSGSTATMLPLTTVALVVSAGTPVVSAMPPGKPSSDTVPVAACTTGRSLVPVTVMVSVVVVTSPWPFDTA